MTHPHEHTHCKDLLDFISDYIDADLSPSLCAELEKHLRECENCRVVVDTVRKTVSLYHETGRETPVPDGLQKRLFRALNLDDLSAK
jgi:predicted anti-sigma-YlaC factor YlaD